MKKYVIIAPHADDEIIGCYEFLLSGLVESVLFNTRQGEVEAIPSSEHFGFRIGSIDELADLALNENLILLFPDHTYETHPDHRKLGSLGEDIWRAGQAVIFYSTNMLSPYIHEASSPLNKRHCLNMLYTNKSTLWQYDNKYFLFEGYIQWILKPNKHV